MNLSHIEDYTTANVANYFWVLVAILLLGVVVNVLPPVRDFVDATEKRAADIVKTPLTPFRGARCRGSVSGVGEDEETPLLSSAQQQHQRDFGKEPILIKMGSMREGPKIKAAKKIKAGMLHKMYRAASPPKKTGGSTTTTGGSGGGGGGGETTVSAPLLIHPRRGRSGPPQHAESR